MKLHCLVAVRQTWGPKMQIHFCIGIHHFKKKNEAIVFPNSGDMSHDDWTIANLTNQPKIKSLFQQCLKRRDTVQISSPLGAEMKVPCGLQNCFGGGYHP